MYDTQRGSMARLVSVVLLVIFVRVSQASHGLIFSYNEHDSDGPSHWIATQCGSTTRQSPIDIISSLVKHNSSFTTNFDCHSPGEKWPVVLSNNGHTITARADPGCWTSVDQVPEFGKGTFNLLGFHFHFSSGNTNGSEHEIDGQGFPAEMHFVHMNNKYNTLKEALQHSDGLMVVGALFKLGLVSNNEISKIIRKARCLKTSSSPVNLNVDLFDLLGAPGGLYTYDGSLTTPPCSEVVQWFIMETTINITQGQLERLRELRTGGPTSPPISEYGNCRGVQPMSGRTVYANF